MLGLIKGKISTIIFHLHGKECIFHFTGGHFIIKPQTFLGPKLPAIFSTVLPINNDHSQKFMGQDRHINCGECVCVRYKGRRVSVDAVAI